jgi:ribose 5-phosphate isomerase B
VRGVRAALCNDLYTARMARAHNDANVLSMGARVVGTGLADEIVDLFVSTPFEGGRHARRVALLTELEEQF